MFSGWFNITNERTLLCLKVFTQRFGNDVCLFTRKCNGDWNMTPYWTVPLKSIKKDERNDTDGQVTSGVAVLELKILRAVNLFE